MILGESLTMQSCRVLVDRPEELNQMRRLSHWAHVNVVPGTVNDKTLSIIRITCRHPSVEVGKGLPDGCWYTPAISDFHFAPSPLSLSSVCLVALSRFLPQSLECLMTTSDILNGILDRIYGDYFHRRQGFDVLQRFLEHASHDSPLAFLHTARQKGFKSLDNLASIVDIGYRKTASVRILQFTSNDSDAVTSSCHF